MSSKAQACWFREGWLVSLAAGAWGMSGLAGCASQETAAARDQGGGGKLQSAPLPVDPSFLEVEDGAPTATAVSDVTPVDVARADASWPIEAGSAQTSVSSTGIAADAGGDVWVTGYILAALDGSERARSDAFISRYSALGELRWTSSLGSAVSDAAAGVSTDQVGNAFIAGDTSGALDGAALGFGDAFVAKYSPEGALEWTRQIGTAQPDAASAVSAAASGDVFVAGFTRGALEGNRQRSDADVWLAKYSSAGEPLWIRQWGSSPGYDERAAGVSADADGNVFVAGYSFGGLEADNQGSADAFVAQFSEQGELLWLRQLGGTGYDAAEAVRADGNGNVYISGQMGGVLAGGPGVVVPGHPFLARYSRTGELSWLLEMEEAALGAASSVSTDADGNPFIAGYTSAEWGGPHRGLYDSFVASVSSAGELLAVRQPGLEELDKAVAVSADATGQLFVLQNIWNRSGNGLDQAFVLRPGFEDAD